MTRFRIPVALGCLVVAVWLAGSWRDARRVHRAQDAIAAGRLLDAERLAAAASGSSVAVEAARTRAVVALRLGDLARAQRDIAAALKRAPNDWALHRDDAVLLLRSGDRQGARAQIRRALELNPRMTLPDGFVPRQP